MKWTIALFFCLNLQFMMLFDFETNSNLNGWYVVEDGVMGGRSQGVFSLNTNGHGEYKGEVSLENNGGFSSLRYVFPKINVENQKEFVLRLKGDGKAYQFRAKSSSNQRYSYIGNFKTSGEWETIRINMSDMYPAFRGYELNQSNYSGKSLSEIAFLIGNKKAESFKLVIDKISIE